MGLLLATALASGCRLPGSEGPISRSLATSRQFSQRGVTAIETGQWVEAEELLAKAVKCCPENLEARRHYAEALWHRGRRAEAVAQLEAAAMSTHADIASHTRLAEMWLAMGELERAGREAETTLDLDPRSATAWATRARVMRAAGQVDAAMADYHRALGLAPNDRVLLLETAEVYRELNQPHKALSMLQALLDTYSPGEEPQQIAQLQGLAYRALGRHKDAGESFALALRQGPPTAELLYQLAEAQSQAGRREEASAAAVQALALDPGHQPSRELLGRLEIAAPPGNPMLR